MAFDGRRYLAELAGHDASGTPVLLARPCPYNGPANSRQLALLAGHDASGTPGLLHDNAPVWDGQRHWGYLAGHFPKGSGPLPVILADLCATPPGCCPPCAPTTLGHSYTVTIVNAAGAACLDGRSMTLTPPAGYPDGCVWVSAGDLTLPGLTLLPGACGGSILHWSGMVLTASLTCESTGFLLVLNALQTSAAGPPTYIAQASWVSPVVAPAGCSPLSIDSGVITCVFNPLSSICGSPNDCGNANCSDSDVCHLVGSTLHLVIS